MRPELPRPKPGPGRKQLRPAVNESDYQELLSRFPSLEKIGRPCLVLQADVELFYIAWGHNGINGDFPKRVTYQVNALYQDPVWCRDQTLGGFSDWFVDCPEPTLAEVCKQLRKRGFKMTALDGALSLVSEGGELELCNE